jgi:endonuclease-3 related protein
LVAKIFRALISNTLIASNIQLPKEYVFGMGVNSLAPYCILHKLLPNTASSETVEKALGNLRQANALTLAGLAALDETELQNLIRPSGFFRQKAASLKLFIRHLERHYQGDLALLLGRELKQLRTELLSLNGIGPETADAILLYAADQPSFVIDAYTRRLLQRNGLSDETASYDVLRRGMMDALPQDSELFNEFHALIVRTCKDYCLKLQPRCTRCPLQANCQTGRTSCASASG